MPASTHEIFRRRQPFTPRQWAVSLGEELAATSTIDTLQNTQQIEKTILHLGAEESS
jgi:hypothetical protein